MALNPFQRCKDRNKEYLRGRYGKQKRNLERAGEINTHIYFSLLSSRKVQPLFFSLSIAKLSSRNISP